MYSRNFLTTYWFTFIEFMFCRCWGWFLGRECVWASNVCQKFKVFNYFESLKTDKSWESIRHNSPSLPSSSATSEILRIEVKFANNSNYFICYPIQADVWSILKRGGYLINITRRIYSKLNINYVLYEHRLTLNLCGLKYLSFFIPLINSTIFFRV